MGLPKLIQITLIVKNLFHIVKTSHKMSIFFDRKLPTNISIYNSFKTAPTFPLVETFVSFAFSLAFETFKPYALLNTCVKSHDIFIDANIS